MKDFRVGIGYDVHRFADDRELWLCGVKIDHPQGLLGHSDADVALHAVIDAVLGAVGAGDIGQWFPDSDTQYKGADSKKLLAAVMASPELANWQINNLDVIIIAQVPKILPHVPAMRSTLAQLLSCSEERISIKGKTTEKLGFTGRKEGIAAQAAVSMVKM